MNIYNVKQYTMMDLSEIISIYFYTFKAGDGIFWYIKKKNSMSFTNCSWERCQMSKFKIKNLLTIHGRMLQCERKQVWCSKNLIGYVLILKIYLVARNTLDK